MADLTPITTSRFYCEFDDMTEKMVKSIQEVTFTGKVKGNDKALMSTKGGKTIRQSTSTGFEENPNITLEIYLTEGDKEFYDWMESTMPSSYGGKGKWSDNRKNGAVTAYDPSDEAILRWEITNAWVKSYSVSEFSADGEDFAVETYELVCEDIRRVQP